MKNKFTYQEGDYDTDGAWYLKDTNIHIQDCKSYSGFYAVNQDFLDDPDKEYIELIGTAKTLAEAKKIALGAI
jgi:hypothetical protein